MKKILTLTLLLGIGNIATAQLITSFSPVISVTQKGDITFAANSITTCTGVGAACTNGRAEVPSAGPTNNQTTGITIGYIDIDGNTGIGAQTFSSSSATLDMGGVLGCGVIYAYLTWGGFVVTGTTANYAKRDSIYFQVPGGANYNKLKADILKDNTSPYNATYHCYKDVTSIVKAAGPGVYTAANVVAATGGNNQFAGWTLVVLYSNPNKSLKNLTIFRGLAGVSGTNPAVQFNISGFFTPPSPAPVNIKLGVITYDGDRALTGDSLKFNGVAVSSTRNPQNDFFNSSITVPSAFTGLDTENIRNPAYTNTLGYDADLVSLQNSTYTYLGNSTSSATLRLSTGGETYLTDIITTAIDVFEPEMRFEKTFTNISGHTPALLGDTIEYSLKIYNKGSDPADSLIVIDSLYGALNYVANSMSVVNGANTGIKTDGIGDDQMDFVAAGNFIRARLGNNANGTRGGTLNNIAPDSVTTIRFRASITNDCTIFHCMDSVYNMAYATYYGKTSVQKRSSFSSANGIDAGTGCALTGATGLRVQVPVCSLPADTTFSNCSPYPLSNLAAARPGYTTYYNSSWVQVTNAATTGTYYAVKSIYPSNYYLTPCNDTVQINFTSVCVLPIKLVSFDVSYNKPGVDIYWSTSQEINNHHFEIERSIDGIHFTKALEVAGAGNSNTLKQYSATDYNFPKTGRLFYRLVQVDYDGLRHTSPVKTVLLSEYKEQSLVIEKIAPNPASEKTTLSVVSANEVSAIINISDSHGKLVKILNQKITKGLNDVTLDLAGFSSGIYLVQIINSGTGEKSGSRLLVH